MDLSAKQRKFVEAYLLEPNATKAAVAAGYAEGSAGVQGYRLLKNDNVAQAIERARQINNFRSTLNPQMIIDEYRKIAFANITDIVQWVTMHVPEPKGNGDKDPKARKRVLRPRPIPEVSVRDSLALHPDLSAAISEVVFMKTGALKIKMHDKNRALEKLAHYYGMFGVPASSVKEPAQEPLGKKELAREAARRAGEGTEWEDDLKQWPN